MLSYVDGYLYFDYLAADASAWTLVYNPVTKAWSYDTYLEGSGFARVLDSIKAELPVLKLRAVERPPVKCLNRFVRKPGRSSLHSLRITCVREFLLRDCIFAKLTSDRRNCRLLHYEK